MWIPSYTLDNIFPMETPKHNMVEEAIRIVDYATEKNTTLRLLGGLAIRLHCIIEDFCVREYSDFDLVGLSEEKESLMKVFEDMGYTPDLRFNALHGHKRLKFEDHLNDRHVDVFLDHFDMDHDWDLSRRVHVEQYTLPLSDLLLTKLQICKINEKDIRDSITILKDSVLGEEDTPTIINMEYIADICSGDWELYTSVLDNMKILMNFLDIYPLEDAEKDLVRSRVKTLTHTLITHPKTAKWKLRSAVGKHLAWCEQVEE